MGMLEIFVALVALAGIVIAVVFNTKYKDRKWDIYYPHLAWMRGGMYFSFCWTLSYLTGGMELILNNPIFTEEQLNNTNWLIYTGCAFLFIVCAYSINWCYFTPVFERKKKWLPAIVFGFLWGSSSGQLFLSVWLLANMTGLPVWWASGAAFLVLAAYQPNWHNIYWDHYIAPEHDTPLTQVIKATCCHIPNLLILLPYLTIYENYTLFVGAQVWACVSACLGMHFPAPWDKPSALNYAERNEKKRCTGYRPKGDATTIEDYRKDPYTPYYPGWTGPDKD